MPIKDISNKQGKIIYTVPIVKFPLFYKLKYWVTYSAKDPHRYGYPITKLMHIAPNIASFALYFSLKS